MELQNIYIIVENNEIISVWESFELAEENLKDGEEIFEMEVRQREYYCIIHEDYHLKTSFSLVDEEGLPFMVDYRDESGFEEGYICEESLDGLNFCKECQSYQKSSRFPFRDVYDSFGIIDICIDCFEDEIEKRKNY